MGKVAWARFEEKIESLDRLGGTEDEIAVATLAPPSTLQGVWFDATRVTSKLDGAIQSLDSEEALLLFEALDYDFKVVGSAIYRSFEASVGAGGCHW